MTENNENEVIEATETTASVDDFRMYEIDERMQARLDNDYVYHSPKGNQQFRYVAIREKAKELAETICKCSPQSREQSVALTNLEQAVF